MADNKVVLMKLQNYDIFLDVDFEKLTFTGRVLLKLESEGNITLNSSGLTIQNIMANGNSLQFEQKNEDLIIKTKAYEGIIKIEYHGSIPDLLIGIYKAPYNNTHMITTQFEATNARRMFPCKDNPEYKAEFILSIKCKSDLDVISNMPIQSVAEEDNKKIVTFHKTPKMSTYLLYVGIGKFEELAEKMGNKDVIVATIPGKGSKGHFALEATKRSIEFFESYFKIPYMLPKIHLLAIPEFAAGAMENWGAITFRESTLLSDENSSVFTRKRIVEVIAHELAHQWFGNLVTMKWWNDLWLSESFATFMSYKVMEAFYPEWEMWEDFLLSRTASALLRDSLKETHPIVVTIKSSNEIRQIFDEISYSKGASILRMIEAYMGTEDFRKGIYDYLINHQYSNATSKNLWDSLEKISGKQVTNIIRQWIEKPGYPLVTATINDNKLVLRQERFMLSGSTEKDFWPIPITLKVDGEIKKLLFDTKEKVLDINVKSLKLNVEQTGFYRVYYDGIYDLVWKSDLSSLDRWGIISDAFSFLVAGKTSFNEYLSFVKRYNEEYDYLPAHEVSNQLSLLYQLAPLQVTDVTKKFHRSQLAGLKGKTSENSSMLRGIIARRLTMIDIEYAKEIASKYSASEEIDPDMKDAVAIAYARANGDFEGVISRYRESSSDEERIRWINSMMSFKDASLVSLSLGMALSGEVKKQEIGSMIIMASRNPDAKDIVWKWIKININRVNQLYEGTGSLSRVLNAIIPLLGIGKVQEVINFFKSANLPEAETGISAGIERLKIYDNLMKTMTSYPMQ